MKKIILGILCVAAIAAATIILLPIIKEQRAYNKVKNKQSVSACDSYEKDWPEGKHIEDVTFMRIKAATDDGSRVDEIVKYLRRYPEGSYANEANAIWNEIWDKEINKYETKAKDDASVKGRMAMMEILQFMKKNRVNTIAMTCRSEMSIKEFNEYDEEIQSLMERTNETSLPYKDGIVGINSNFDHESQKSLSTQLSQFLQGEFDHIFTAGFIKVAPADESTDNSSLKCPTITIDYKISTMETIINDKSYPQIWAYPYADEDEETNVDAFISNILIDADLHITIPESESTITQRESGELIDYFKMIKNSDQAYMETASLFLTGQVKKLAKNLGIGGR